MGESKWHWHHRVCLVEPVRNMCLLILKDQFQNLTSGHARSSHVLWSLIMTQVVQYAICISSEAAWGAKSFGAICASASPSCHELSRVTAWGSRDTPPPGGGPDPTHPQFFVNNLHFVADIDAKLDIPFCTSILRILGNFWMILSKTFWVIPILVTQCHAIFGRRTICKCFKNRQKISE